MERMKTLDKIFLGIGALDLAVSTPNLVNKVAQGGGR